MVTNPVFRTCVRCGYSLRGLPTRHVCPECGLRYDERCALYRATNPRQVLALWLMIFGGGWVVLEFLPGLFNMEAATTLEVILGGLSLVWIACVAGGTWSILKRYRRGFKVATTTDGLLIHLPGFHSELIPYPDIEGASVKPSAKATAMVVLIKLRSKRKRLEIGGVANVFPSKTDGEDFVRRVRERIESGIDAPAANEPPGTRPSLEKTDSTGDPGVR